MTDAGVIERAARVLADAAGSPAQVIVFGSAARGDAGPDSDLDFLVLEDDVPDGVGESVRLREALGNLGVPVDVIVMEKALAARRARIPGSMVYAAMREGRVVAES